MCTSKSQETDKIWGLRQGARDYVVKPVDRDELLRRSPRSADRTWQPDAEPLMSRVSDEMAPMQGASRVE